MYLHSVLVYIPYTEFDRIRVHVLTCTWKLRFSDMLGTAHARLHVIKSSMSVFRRDAGVCVHTNILGEQTQTAAKSNRDAFEHPTKSTYCTSMRFNSVSTCRSNTHPHNVCVFAFFLDWTFCNTLMYVPDKRCEPFYVDKWKFAKSSEFSWSVLNQKSLYKLWKHLSINISIFFDSYFSGIWISKTIKYIKL